MDEDKLDKVLTKLDSINARIDSIETEHKKDRADAADMKACVDSVRKDADERKEKEEKDRADKARADAEASEKAEKEKADKARADAEEEARKEKEKADAASRAIPAEVLQRISELERTRPASLSDEDKGRFAEVQMRADAAYHAWNYGPAPHALNGETLSDYRVRLLGKIKPHSKVYKESNLGVLVNDSAAFSVIEETIVNDAVEASSANITVGGPLRKQVTRSESGHTITKWFGDPAVTWSRFMGGATKFGKINRDFRSH